MVDRIEKLYCTDNGSLWSFIPFGLLNKTRKVASASMVSGSCPQLDNVIASIVCWNPGMSRSINCVGGWMDLHCCGFTDLVIVGWEPWILGSSRFLGFCWHCSICIVKMVLCVDCPNSADWICLWMGYFVIGFAFHWAWSAFQVLCALSSFSTTMSLLSISFAIMEDWVVWVCGWLAD